MKFVGKVLALIACLALGSLVFDAEGFALQDGHIERNTVLLSPNQYTAHIGKAAAVILIVNADDGAIGNRSGFFVACSPTTPLANNVGSYEK